VKREIPIENIYYLFCYAWDRFPEGRAIGVGAVKSPEICDLFASVLIRGVNRLMRRGLDRGYRETQDDITGVRGRIVLADTLRRMLLRFGRANCRLDDLTYDILNNQIIKTTITRLSVMEQVDSTLRHELGRLNRLFSEVADVALLIKICNLVHSALLPHEDGSGSKFLDILENETMMWDVFQSFVLNFLKSEQREFSVRSEYIQWDALATSASNPTSDDLNKPSQPYPCEDCENILPARYCDVCKAQYDQKQQAKREREEQERQRAPAPAL
jgi:5-methylcytosine-specific restriction enzyme subunit McrC